MGESFTIQISSNLVRHLVDDDKKLKKKTKKQKPKIPRESNHFPTCPPNKLSNDSETLKATSEARRPYQPPLYVPVPAPQHVANAELDAIRSVLHESETLVDRLQKREEDMLSEVTQRAKDLHEKEFKLPNYRPSHCLNEKDACLKCYKENLKDPLKCAGLVKDFADCARRVRQQAGAPNN